MQLVIIAVGKLKERFWREALAEYAKRLSAYAEVDIVEVPDEPAPERFSDAQRQQVLNAESERITKYLRDRDCVIALDIRGKALTSEEWSHTFTALQAQGHGRMVFIVGGSHGLNATLLERANLRWSFGPLTLPHQLARVVLAEQIYRGVRIARGEPYHK